MTKPKPTKYEDDIRRNLRKSAEINAPQSTHDGIHTCSKGCKKSGCNRGLHDTIEEQNAQIEALKQDLLEQTAAVRNSRMANIHDLNYVGGLQEENARLKAEVESLKKPAVIGGYNISEYIRMANSETLEFDNGDIFADMTLPERIKYIVESHARLKAEVERLNTLCKQVMSQHSDISCENIMLRKAGDAVIADLEHFTKSGWFDKYKSVKRWNAAKDGKLLK